MAKCSCTTHLFLPFHPLYLWLFISTPAAWGTTILLPQQGQWSQKGPPLHLPDSPTQGRSFMLSPLSLCSRMKVMTAPKSLSLCGFWEDLAALVWRREMGMMRMKKDDGDDKWERWWRITKKKMRVKREAKGKDSDEEWRGRWRGK